MNQSDKNTDCCKYEYSNIYIDKILYHIYNTELRGAYVNV